MREMWCSKCGSTKHADGKCLKAEPPVRSGEIVSQHIMKITFDDIVEATKETMTEAGAKAAKQLGQSPPTIREEKTLTGVRLVMVWPDGEETNEAVIQRVDDQTAMAG